MSGIRRSSRGARGGADVTSARELLGFEAAVDFTEGMRELVSWVREQEADDRSEAAHAELAQRGLAR